MDIAAHMAIGFIDGDVRQTRQETSNLTNRFRELKRRLDNQSAVIKVLMSLLVQTTGTTDAEILRRVLDLTARTDAPSPPDLCSACGRTLSRRCHTCNYCGTERPIESVSELLDL